MQQNFVKEDFMLHRASTKRCTVSIKVKFLTLVLFKFEGVYKNLQNLDDFLTFRNEIF